MQTQPDNQKDTSRVQEKVLLNVNIELFQRVIEFNLGIRQLWKFVKEKPNIAADIVTALAGTVTAIATLMVFSQAGTIANQAKVTAVLSLHEQPLKEEKLGDSFTEVSKAMLAAKKKISAIKNEEEYREFGEYILETAYGSNSSKGSEDKGIEDDIQIVLSFYRGVASCVNQDICDKRAADAIFKDDIKEFNVIFAPYFCDLAAKTKDYEITMGLETFYVAERGVNNVSEKTCSDWQNRIVAEISGSQVVR